MKRYTPQITEKQASISDRGEFAGEFDFSPRVTFVQSEDGGYVLAADALRLESELAEARRETVTKDAYDALVSMMRQRDADFNAELAALRARLALAEKLAEAAEDLGRSPDSGNLLFALNAALRAFEESKP